MCFSLVFLIRTTQTTTETSFIHEVGQRLGLKLTPRLGMCFTLAKFAGAVSDYRSVVKCDVLLCKM